MRLLASLLVAFMFVPSAQAEIIKTKVGERNINTCAQCSSPHYHCQERWKYEDTVTGEVRYRTTTRHGRC